MTHFHARGPNIDPRESVVSGAIPGGMFYGVFVFHCAINASDLIEDDAQIRHFNYIRQRSGPYEGVIVKLAFKLGQQHE